MSPAACIDYTYMPASQSGAYLNGFKLPFMDSVHPQYGQYVIGRIPDLTLLGYYSCPRFLTLVMNDADWVRPCRVAAANHFLFFAFFFQPCLI